MIKITSKKTYEVGDRVKCILPGNTSLVFGREYIVESMKYNSVEVSDPEDKYSSDTPFNPARFISTKEIREAKINTILDK